MSKKIFLIIGIILVLLSGISYAFVNQPKHPSDYHIGIKYEEAVKSDKPMLIVFYADWCAYCLKFMPKFSALSKIYSNKYNFVMLNAELNAQNVQLANSAGITGFPTVYILDPKYDNKILLSNSIYQDLSKFRVELDRYLRIRAILDKK